MAGVRKASVSNGSNWKSKKLELESIGRGALQLSSSPWLASAGAIGNRTSHHRDVEDWSPPCSWSESNPRHAWLLRVLFEVK